MDNQLPAVRLSPADLETLADLVARRLSETIPAIAPLRPRLDPESVLLPLATIRERLGDAAARWRTNESLRRWIVERRKKHGARIGRGDGTANLADVRQALHDEAKDPARRRAEREREQGALAKQAEAIVAAKRKRQGPRQVAPPAAPKKN